MTLWQQSKLLPLTDFIELVTAVIKWETITSSTAEYHLTVSPKLPILHVMR